MHMQNLSGWRRPHASAEWSPLLTEARTHFEDSDDDNEDGDDQISLSDVFHKAKTEQPRPTMKRYTLEDLERPVVTAVGTLLDADDSKLFNVLSDIGEIQNKHLYPVFSFYLRQFHESIADYLRDPIEHACELDFWRGTMGYIYGERLCILASLMFGLEITVERLRRLAEAKMGLPKWSLNPAEPNPLRQEERASHVQKVFSEIVAEHGHLSDPVADSFFVIQRRKPRKARKPECSASNLSE